MQKFILGIVLDKLSQIRFIECNTERVADALFFLSTYYKNKSKVAELISLGDIIELGTEIGCYESFYRPRANDVIYAGRDGLMNNKGYKTARQLCDVFKYAAEKGFPKVFIFKNNKWLCFVSGENF